MPDDWSLEPGLGSYHRIMGFNPFRKQTTSRLDIALVVGAIGIAVALVVWAILWP